MKLAHALARSIESRILLSARPDASVWPRISSLAVGYLRIRLATSFSTCFELSVNVALPELNAT